MNIKIHTTRLLTTEEAAREWNISKKAIYRLVRDGKLRPIIGFKSWMFEHRDLFQGQVLERL
jgi:predicted site-specific integrase-resolvase